MLRLVLLLDLLASATAYTSYLQTLRFPHTPAISGQYYIHSPEYFLRTHGLCGPGFSLLSTQPPMQCGDHICTVMTYQTLLDGTMHARVFTNDGNRSHFMLTDHMNRPCVMGNLHLVHLGQGRGFVLRCFASRLRPLGIWDVMLGSPSPRKEYVESMVQACCNSTCEDINLKSYRRIVMRLR